MAEPEREQRDEPITTTTVAEPWPDAAQPTLRIVVGACRLRLLADDGTDDTEPGGEAPGVRVAYTDPTRALTLHVTHDHEALRLTQHTRRSQIRGFRARLPEMTVRVSPIRPFTIAIDAGACDVDLDLGGLPVAGCTVRLAAGSAHIGASRPTLDEHGGLGLLDVEAGAAAVTLVGLGDASPERVHMAGGAASCDVGFGGTLRRECSARLSAAGASLTVRVPMEVAARVGVTSVLSGLTVDEGYQAWEDSFWTPSGVDGAHPMLSVDASVTLGSLEVTPQVREG
jgi:hypothetical protein